MLTLTLVLGGKVPDKELEYFPPTPYGHIPDSEPVIVVLDIYLFTIIDVYYEFRGS